MTTLTQTPPRPAYSDRVRRWLGSDRIRPVVLPLITTVILLTFWEAVVRGFGIAPVTLPAPTDIAQNFVRNFDFLWPNAVQTTKEAVLGLCIAIVLGVLGGGIIAYSRTLREATFPHLIFFQLTPKVALAPLFIAWLGLGMEARLAFTIFMSFFPILIATASGLSNVEARYVRFAYAITATKRQAFLYVRLPFALPQIFAGLKIGVTMAFIGMIVGEFITSQSGLGYLILFASTRADTTTIFSAIFLLCAIGLSIFGIVALVERMVSRRFDAR